MQAKSKIIIALSSLFVVLVVIVSAMAVTFASVNQRVNSVVRITYIAQSVHANVSANKYFRTNEPIPFSGGTDGVVTFGESSSSNQSLSTESTTLTAYYNYVIMEYVFENTSNSTMNVSVSASSLDNLDMFYTSPQTTRKTDIYSGFDQNDYTQGTTTPAANIAAHTTAYVYVAIKIKRLANNANFAGQFVWNIRDGEA